MDKYEFGKCIYCGKETALKNGTCAECEKGDAPIPDFMKDIFGGFKDEEKSL